MSAGQARRGPRRTHTQIIRDRREIARLYLQGWTQAAIGEKLGFVQQQISYDLKQIRKSWLKAAIQDYDELVAEQLAKLDHLEVTFWEAWEKSLEESTATTAYAVKGKSGEPEQQRAIYKTDPGLGDPRWLEGVLRCIDRRCKLLGLDKPAGVDVTTGGQALATAQSKTFEEALARVYGNGQTEEIEGEYEVRDGVETGDTAGEQGDGEHRRDDGGHGDSGDDSPTR